MPSRGFVWGQYHSDDGLIYAIRVDADYHAMPERGWTTPASAGAVIYPRQWTPRKVVGLDELGHPRRAVVASANAPLWVGQADVFTIQGSDQQNHQCSVIRSLTEKRSSRPS